MDWYSRKVLSWQLSNKMDTHFCIEWLEEALDLNGRPDIFNTDQGSQFTSFDFISVLKENKVRISIDGKDKFLSNYLGEVWSASVFISRYLKMAFNHANKLVYSWGNITKLGLILNSKEKIIKYPLNFLTFLVQNYSAHNINIADYGLRLR